MHSSYIASLAVAVGLASAVGHTAERGALIPLHTFACSDTIGTDTAQSVTCPDGLGLNSVIQASDGNFYGSTGASAFSELYQSPLFSGGTLFKLTPAGQFSTIFKFEPNSTGVFANGRSASGLVEGRDGKLYGVIQPAESQGFLFRIAKDGTGLQLLGDRCSLVACTTVGSTSVPKVSFTVSNLLLGRDGNLYGLLNEFVGVFSPTGAILFRYVPSTNTTTALAHFGVGPAGSTPLSLAQDKVGNFILSDGVQIFSVDASGHNTVIFSFPFSNFPDLEETDSLIPAKSGLLFGTFFNVFDDGLTQFYSLSDTGNFVAFPVSSPSIPGPLQLQASDGNLWGSSPAGFFAVSAAAGQVVTTLPAAGGQIRTVAQGADGRFFGIAEGLVPDPINHVTPDILYQFDAGLPAPPASDIVTPRRGQQ